MAFKLYYWTGCNDFLGRGWAPLMTLEESGKEFTTEAPDNKPQGCFAVPCVTTPGGASVGQTATVVTVIGKETGLWPKDVANDAKAMQLCVDSTDLFSEADKPLERLEKWFAHIEAQLTASGGPFLFGASVTAADFHIYSAVQSG